MINLAARRRLSNPESTGVSSPTSAPHKTAPKAGARRIPLRIRHGHVPIAGRELPTPVVLTALFEATLLAVSGLLAPCLRFAQWPASIWQTMPELPLKIAAFVLITLLGLMSVGFYRRGLRAGFNDLFLRIVGALILSSIGLGFLYYLYPDLILGRGTLLIAFALTLPLLLLSRLLLVPLLDHSAFARRVLVVGAGDMATNFNRLRRKVDRRGFVITGYIRWARERVKVAPEQIIELAGSLHNYARANGIDDIVIALDDQRGSLPITELVHCKMDGIQVLDVADFLERECGLLKLGILRPGTLVFSRHFRQSFYRNIVKRLLDLTVGLGLLIATSPIMALTALGILIESRFRDTILFRQTRVGENGQTFTLYKFRSMVMDAERDGVARWASKDDPRVTRIGALIRKTRIDELPQLFNVLKGDMSFVGPRPERPEFVVDLSKKLPYYEWRHWVKPGLTGWAQIHYPYGASEQDAFEKLQYDLYYVKYQNLVLDLLTIMQTVEVVLWGRGSR